MAKRKYRPYPTRKEKKSRQLRNVAMTMIALIVAIVIFIRSYEGPQSETEGQPAQEQTVQLDQIMPSKAPLPEKPKPQPITVLNPAAASAQQPTQIPDPKPISSPEPILKTEPDVKVSEILALRKAHSLALEKQRTKMK